MSPTVLPADDPFADLLSRLPATLDLDGLALATKAIQRRRGLRSGADLLRLGLAWGPGERSLQEAAAWSGLLGFAHLTDEALIQRLHKAVGFFEGITAHLLRAAAETISWPGRQIRLCDATCLSGPASQGTDWRIHGVYDLGARRFSHLEVTDCRGAEGLERGVPVAGEIRIADRGYATAQAWHRFRAAGGPDSDFIVRLRWNTVRLLDETGQPFDLIGWLTGLPTSSAGHASSAGHDIAHEQPVQVVGARGQEPLALRLVARRKTPEAAAATLKHLRRQASRKQNKLDPRSEVAAAFVLLATSLSGDTYPAHEVLAAYRLRWQIELAFKRLKSLLHVGRLRTRTQAGTRCWLHTHLIMALLCDEQSQDLLDAFPSGPR